MCRVLIRKPAAARMQTPGTGVTLRQCLTQKHKIFLCRNAKYFYVCSREMLATIPGWVTRYMLGSGYPGHAVSKYCFCRLTTRHLDTRGSDVVHIVYCTGTWNSALRAEIAIGIRGECHPLIVLKIFTFCISKLVLLLAADTSHRPGCPYFISLK